jgi:tetratricopeptide (TPR) repeat protein
MAVQGLFEEGIKFYESKDYAQAVDLFKQALDQQPNNVTLLVNKALAHYELGQKFESYALLKKAITLNPASEAAQQGLEFISNQVQVKEVPHNIEFYEQTRSLLVKPFSPNTPLAFLLVLFALTGIYWIRHLSQKKKAFLAGEDSLPMGTPGWISFVLCLFSLFWTVFYKWDLQVPRALITKETLALHSAPTANSPTILELNGGLEVRVLRKQDQWVQVQFPGSFSGWTEKDSVLEL